MIRLKNAAWRFVGKHAKALASGLGAFTAISVFLLQYPQLKAIPKVGTVIGILGLLLPIARIALDWLNSSQAARQQEHLAAITAPGAEQRTRTKVQAAVQAIVNTRLDTPLGERLELALLRKPAEVDDPQRAAIGQVAGPDTPVPAGTKVLDLYTGAQRQILILGQGGAGKSGILLDLAAALLDVSQTDATAPIPVVLQVGSWSVGTTSLRDWLVVEVGRIYPIDPLLVQKWLTDQALVPVLDGLDTAGDEAAANCIDAINEFVDDTKSAIVVASRLTEYESLRKKLRFHDAVAVQPLSEAQIVQAVSGPGLQGVAQAIRADAGLMELMNTPWFLGIVVSTYRGKVGAAMPAGGTPAAWRAQILDEYISGCLNKAVLDKDPRFTPASARHWLGWLARKMLDRKREVFFYDLMQPDLLPSQRQVWQATIGVAAVIGGLTGILALAGYIPIFGWLSIFLAAVGGVVVGMAAFEPHIVPATRLRWSWGQLRASIPGWLGFGPLFGLLAGVSVLAIAELQGAHVARAGFLISGVFAGLCLAAFFALVGALRSEIPEEPPGPGDSIRSTLTTALKGGVMMALASALIAAFGGGIIVEVASLPHGIREDLYYWLVPGLIVQGLAISLVLGIGGIDPGVRVGLRRTWRTSVVIGLGVAIVDSQVAAFMSGHFGVYDRFVKSGTDPGLVAGLLLAVLVGIGTGICHGMLRGGGTYIRHKALLGFLTRDGAIAPDYLAFLQYASRVRLIRRRGGGYEFLHRFLLEHFADSGTGPSIPAPSEAAKPVAVDA